METGVDDVEWRNWRNGNAVIVGNACPLTYYWDDHDTLFRKLEEAEMNRASVSTDLIRAELFRRYPNGLAWREA